jgi:hypothetical protein
VFLGRLSLSLWKTDHPALQASALTGLVGMVKIRLRPVALCA